MNKVKVLSESGKGRPTQALLHSITHNTVTNKYVAIVIIKDEYRVIDLNRIRYSE